MTTSQTATATNKSQGSSDSDKEGIKVLPYKDAYAKYSDSFFATNVRLEAAHFA